VNRTDVIWSNELKDFMVYLATSTESIRPIATYLVEHIAENDEKVSSLTCDGTCGIEMFVYNTALSKAIQKSKHFKDVTKFFSTASDYYCHDYNNDLVSYLKRFYDVEVTA
tara:strand:+ start:5378 stop:5710 length:333 start_codon:yes stop_codon:yes gene_type:complete